MTQQYREEQEERIISTFADIKGDIEYFLGVAQKYGNRQWELYCNDILKRQQILSKCILAAFSIVEDLLEKYSYDSDLIDALVEIVEDNCVSPSGASKKLKMAPVQRFIIGLIWGLGEGHTAPVHQLMLVTCRGPEWEMNMIPTPNGMKYMRDIEIGDLVFDLKGKPQKVIDIPFESHEQLYKVQTPLLGKSFIGAYDHKIQVTDWKGTRKDVELRNLTKQRYYMDLFNEPLSYPRAHLPIDPYALGALLGDGCQVNRANQIASADPSLVEEVAKRLGCTYRKNPANYNWALHFRKADYPECLKNYSYDKYIPAEYLRSSVGQRYNLLAGLMDTDGWCDTRGRMSFTSTSVKLADGVLELVKSLGGYGHLSTHKREDRRAEHTVRFNVPYPKMAFHLARKQSKAAASHHRKRVKIASVKPHGVGNIKCITTETGYYMSDTTKSKNSGKTALGSVLALCETIMNRNIGADIDILSPTIKQSRIFYEGIVKMIQAPDTIFDTYVENGLWKTTRDGFRNGMTKSETTILAKDSHVLDGRRSALSFVDEIHAIRDNPLPVLTMGSRVKLPDEWRNIIITTSGFVRDGAYDIMMKRGKDILFGKEEYTDYLPLIFQLDDGDDWLNPSLWQKASCMHGYIVTDEIFKSIYNASRNSPTDIREFKTKMLNIPESLYAAYFYAEDIANLNKGFNEDWLSMGTYCAVGIDLSLVGDITSISFVKRDYRKELYSVKQLNYMTEKAFNELQDGVKERLLRDPNFHVVQADLIEHRHVYKDIKKFLRDEHLTPVSFNYDDWKAVLMVELIKDDFLALGVEVFSVPQNTKGLAPPMARSQTLVSTGRISTNSEVLKWGMENVRSKPNANGDDYPNKSKSIDKIDAYVSFLDALGYFQKVDATTYWNIID